MAKKEEVKQPVVTRLNLPISEESLMVDLPDGQKLVIGKMATGSVIEVATWRGTGRPDSRTTRMMLGMSGAGAEPTVDAADAPAAKPTMNSRKDAVLAFVKAQFVKQEKSAKPAKVPAATDSSSREAVESKPSDVLSKIEKVKEEKKARFSFVKSPEFSKAPSTSSDTGSAFDIDAWIAEIAVKSAKKAEAEKGSSKAPAKTAAKKKAPVKKSAKSSKPQTTRSSTKSKGRGR